MSGGACGDEVQSSAYFPRPDHDLRLNVAKVAYSHSNQVSRIFITSVSLTCDVHFFII